MPHVAGAGAMDLLGGAGTSSQGLNFWRGTGPPASILRGRAAQHRAGRIRTYLGDSSYGGWGGEDLTCFGQHHLLFHTLRGGASSTSGRPYTHPSLFRRPLKGRSHPSNGMVVNKRLEMDGRPSRQGAEHSWATSHWRTTSAPPQDHAKSPQTSFSTSQFPEHTGVVGAQAGSSPQSTREIPKQRRGDHTSPGRWGLLRLECQGDTGSLAWRHPRILIKPSASTPPGGIPGGPGTCDQAPEDLRRPPCQAR